MIDILLIEDNEELAVLIEAFLNKEGFLCYHVISAERALIWLEQNTPRLIILDIMLPDMDGFAFCQAVRRISRIPIFIMSARSTKSDQLMGFELGADDYIEKPVDPDILCAKVRALFSRLQQPRTNGILISGALKIDTEAHKVYLKNNLLDLNVKEYELLVLMVENAGKTLHKDFLFNQIWGMDSLSENQTLTVHIKRLRSQIEENSHEPQRIQTVWGIGYRYEEI